MLSNVIDNFTDQPLADGLVTRIIPCQDKKVGTLLYLDLPQVLSETNVIDSFTDQPLADGLVTRIIHVPCQDKEDGYT